MSNKYYGSEGVHDNALSIKSLLGVLERTVNDVKCLVKHFHMVQTQLEQISNVQKDLLANNAKQDIQAYGIQTRGGTHTQDQHYLEGHPKRIEQDSQVQVEDDIVSSPKKKKKKKKHKEADNSNDLLTSKEPAVDPNSISTSDAETEDGA